MQESQPWAEAEASEPASITGLRYQASPGALKLLSRPGSRFPRPWQQQTLEPLLLAGLLEFPALGSNQCYGSQALLSGTLPGKRAAASLL